MIINSPRKPEGQLKSGNIPTMTKLQLNNINNDPKYYSVLTTRESKKDNENFNLTKLAELSNRKKSSKVRFSSKNLYDKYHNIDSATLYKNTFNSNQQTNGSSLQKHLD